MTGGGHLRQVLARRLKRLVEQPSDAGALDLQQSVSMLVKRGLTVLLMLIVSWLTGFLPGADIALFRRVTMALVLTLGLAVAAVVLVIITFRPAARVLGQFAREAFRLPPGEARFDAPLLLLGWSVALLVDTCLVYWIFTSAFDPVLSAVTTQRWLSRLIDVVVLILAVAAITGAFIGLSPLFGRVGDAVSQQVSPQPEDAPQAKCPKCGVLNPEANRYCAFCGTALADAGDADGASA